MSMKFQSICIVIACFGIVSCRKPENSKELMMQAHEVMYTSELSDEVQVDSSLALTNKAIALDDENVSAYHHKLTLLFRKRDGQGLLETADQLIELSDKPYFLGQKAFFLELNGRESEAKEYYSRATLEYEEFMKKDPNNFDVMLEYVGVLDMSGDSTKANETLREMASINFEDYQLNILEVYRESSISKVQVMAYWKGEITFDQIQSAKDRH
jgi:tetratricopeptide (TPR) repeat protein